MKSEHLIEEEKKIEEEQINKPKEKIIFSTTKNCTQSVENGRKKKEFTLLR